MKTTASSAPTAASRAVSRSQVRGGGPVRRRVDPGQPPLDDLVDAGQQLGGGPAARPAQQHDARRRRPRTARIAGPVSSTSPAESERTTRTRRARPCRAPASPAPTSRCRRRMRSTAPRRSPATAGAAATSSGRVTGVGTRMPLAPAAPAATMSRPMSPTTTHRCGATPRAAAAASTRPGAGLRQRATVLLGVRADLPGVERPEQLLDPGVHAREVARRRTARGRARTGWSPRRCAGRPRAAGRGPPGRRAPGGPGPDRRCRARPRPACRRGRTEPRRSVQRIVVARQAEFPPPGEVNINDFSSGRAGSPGPTTIRAASGRSPVAG